MLSIGLKALTILFIMMIMMTIELLLFFIYDEGNGRNGAYISLPMKSSNSTLQCPISFVHVLKSIMSKSMDKKLVK